MILCNLFVWVVWALCILLRKLADSAKRKARNSLQANMSMKSISYSFIAKGIMSPYMTAPIVQEERYR